MFGFRLVGKILGYIFLMIAVIIVQIVILDIFPFPLNNINIIIAVILWWLVFSADLRALLLVIPVGFFCEVLSAAPFGVTSAALAVSLAFSGWILFHIFTSRSVYIVAFVGLLAVLLFRFLFLFSLLLLGHLTWSNIWLNNELLISIGYEAIFTAGLLFIGHLFIGTVVRRWRLEYINLSLQNDYGKEQKHFWHF